MKITIYYRPRLDREAGDLAQILGRNYSVMTEPMHDGEPDADFLLAIDMPETLVNFSIKRKGVLGLSMAELENMTSGILRLLSRYV